MKKLCGGGYNMGAILWRKNKELMNNKKKLLFLMILMVILTIMIIFRKIEVQDIMFGIPIFNCMLFWLFLFTVEDFVYAEGVLGTKIIIKDIWLGNMFLINIFSFIFSFIQVIIFLIVNNKWGGLSFINILDFIIAFIIGTSLIAFATFYISDYSKMKNIISSIGGVVNIAVFIYILIAKGNLSNIYEYRFYLFIISVVLLGFSIIIVDKYSNTEKFIMNVKNLGQTYDNASTLDE